MLTLPYDTPHPILLPKWHLVMNTVIDQYHLYHLHAGPQLVLAWLSQYVWLLCATNVIFSRFHKYLTCFKLWLTSNAALMVKLPSCLIIPCKSLLSIGIGYGGPHNIKIPNLCFIKQVKVPTCVHGHKSRTHRSWHRSRSPSLLHLQDSQLIAGCVDIFTQLAGRILFVQIQNYVK